MKNHIEPGGSEVDEDPIPAPSDEDDPLTSVDGEAVVVPGQRPGPTEPMPR